MNGRCRFFSAARSCLASLCCLFLSCCAPAGNGAALFQQHGCANCHRFQGQGGSMGPDLTAVATRMPETRLRQYIRNPAATNPATRMPDFAHLQAAELDALMDFLRN